MGILKEQYIEITVNEYKKLLEKEIRLDIIIQNLERDDYVSKEDLLLLTNNPQNKEGKEEQEEEYDKQPNRILV